MPGLRDKTPRTQDSPTPTPAVTAAVAAVEHASARLHALVISDKLVASYPLPETGTVKIGRAPQCEILIDEVSISRNHATLTIGDELVGKRLNLARIPQRARALLNQIGSAPTLRGTHATPALNY